MPCDDRQRSSNADLLVIGLGALLQGVPSLNELAYSLPTVVRHLKKAGMSELIKSGLMRANYMYWLTCPQIMT